MVELLWRCTQCDWSDPDRHAPCCPRCQAPILMPDVLAGPVRSTQAKTVNAYKRVDLREHPRVDDGTWAFTDGATKGAYAAVIVHQHRIVSEHVRYTGPLPMKNVSAEMNGVALALRHCPPGHVHVVSDYMGTGMWMGGLWKIKKKDALMRLRVILHLIRTRELTVEFTHHKGHQKDDSDFTRWNCRADALCDQRPRVPFCLRCHSTRVDEWGESGVFWLHCHDCGDDGPDLED